MRLRSFIACSLLMLIAACQQAPVQRSGPVSFSQMQPIRLDVAQVDVVEEYVSPMKAPNVEHFFATTPAEAVKIWVRDRIRTEGAANRLEVIIKDASVVETELPRTKGVKGVFTNDQTQRYDAKLDVEMRIYGNGAMSEANVTASVTRSRTIAENASVAQREALFNEMTRELMDALNAELEKNISQYFGSYVRY